MPSFSRHLTSLAPEFQAPGPWRVERTITASRIFLATVGLGALWADPTVPGGPSATVYTLLGGYLIFAIVCVALPIRLAGHWVAGTVAHVIDVALAASVTLFTGGSNSPFFLFLTYPLLTAAYRWGLVQTVSTAAAAIVVLTVELVAFAPDLPADDLSLFRFIMRTAYLLIVGVLVGYLADREKRRRDEALCIARMFHEVRSRRTMEEIFDGVLRLTTRFFRARRVLLVMRDARTLRAFCREGPGRGTDTRQRAGTEELSGPLALNHFFPLPGAAVHAFRQRPGGRLLQVVAVDSEGVVLPRETIDAPPEFAYGQPFRRLIVATATFEQRWTARVIVFDPAFTFDREETALAAQRMIGEVGPAMYDRYLIQRLRNRAAEGERGRIVRELHDGPVQSLVGVEMDFAALRRRASAQAPEFSAQLGEFHAVLKRGLTELREVFESVRSTAAAPRPIQYDLQDAIARFGIYSGIEARFSSAGPPVSLPSRARRELLRIVHEALTNVRKHSGARCVRVECQWTDDQLSVNIDDNGRGFDFAGVRSGDDLRLAREGPWSILERVRVLEGELTITSRPGAGARLGIVLPLAAHRVGLA